MAKKGNTVTGTVQGAIEQAMEWISDVQSELEDGVSNMSGTPAENTELYSNMENASGDLQVDAPEIHDELSNLTMTYFVPTRKMDKMERLSEAGTLLRAASSTVEGFEIEETEEATQPTLDEVEGWKSEVEAINAKPGAITDEDLKRRQELTVKIDEFDAEEAGDGSDEDAVTPDDVDEAVRAIDELADTAENTSWS